VPYFQPTPIYSLSLSNYARNTVFQIVAGPRGLCNRETIANLIINRVKLYPDKAVVEGIVPVVPDVLSSAHRRAQLNQSKHSFPFRKLSYPRNKK
jgi:hypothetical protein